MATTMTTNNETTMTTTATMNDKMRLVVKIRRIHMLVTLKACAFQGHLEASPGLPCYRGDAGVAEICDGSGDQLRAFVQRLFRWRSHPEGLPRF